MPVDLSELTEHFKVWRYFHLNFFAFYETHVKYLNLQKLDSKSILQLLQKNDTFDRSSLLNTVLLLENCISEDNSHGDDLVFID